MSIKTTKEETDFWRKVYRQKKALGMQSRQKVEETKC